MKYYFINFLSKVIGIFFFTVINNNLAFAVAGSANSNIYFKATFVGGACEITAPSVIQFNGGEMIMPTEIRQKLSKTIENFNLILSNCSGLGLIPTITVSGESTTDLGIAVFRNIPSQTDADGYGILLSTIGNNSFAANNNLAVENIIHSKDWNSNNLLSSIDKILPIKAVLTCGDCNSKTQRGGDFNATITFNFLYE
ncbi:MULTISPECIES: fimbrial protein [Providencia]|uniref:fimbrial protein n=1 Tax=Providencia TaxID=586 RepID=UPI001E5DBE46|nr:MULTISPECIES: fimbrial-like protein [Providencia]UEK61557.1 fimbrial-like protein [Providencia rettgeri]